MWARLSLIFKRHSAGSSFVKIALNDAHADYGVMESTSQRGFAAAALMEAWNSCPSLRLVGYLSLEAAARTLLFLGAWMPSQFRVSKDVSVANVIFWFVIIGRMCWTRNQRWIIAERASHCRSTRAAIMRNIMSSCSGCEWLVATTFRDCSGDVATISFAKGVVNLI